MYLLSMIFFADYDGFSVMIGSIPIPDRDVTFHLRVTFLAPRNRDHNEHHLYFVRVGLRKDRIQHRCIHPPGTQRARRLFVTDLPFLEVHYSACIPTPGHVLHHPSNCVAASLCTDSPRVVQSLTMDPKYSIHY